MRTDNFDYFYVVKPGDTLSGIVRNVFRTNDSHALKYKVSEIVALNPHVSHPDRIRAGMFLFLGVNSSRPTQNPCVTELLELERIYSTFVPEIKEVVAKESDVLEYIGWGVTMAGSFAEAGQKWVHHAAENLAAPTVKIQEIQTYYLRQITEKIVVVRQNSIQLASRFRIDVVRNRLIKIVVDDSGVRAYSRKLEQLGVIAKSLKWGGRLIKTIDLGLDAKNIYSAWGTPDENRTIARTGTKILGGAAGSFAASYVVCNVLFGIESMGTSLFWCGAIAGGAGAIAGGESFATVTDAAYSTSLGKNLINRVVETFSIPSAY